MQHRRMDMKSPCWLLVPTVLLVGCGVQAPATNEGTATPVPVPAHTPTPHASLAQIMRAIPFPSSNIIFDTQSVDPGAPPKPVERGGGASASFATVYGGWQQVELAALAIAEFSNLVMIPGRLCENGKPVPLDQADFRMWVQGLVDAGQAAYKAAQSKNLEAMSEVSGTVADACAVCHEKYRDRQNNADRCTP